MAQHISMVQITCKISVKVSEDKLSEINMDQCISNDRIVDEDRIWHLLMLEYLIFNVETVNK